MEVDLNVAVQDAIVLLDNTARLYDAAMYTPMAMVSKAMWLRTLSEIDFVDNLMCIDKGDITPGKYDTESQGRLFFIKEGQRNRLTGGDEVDEIKDADILTRYGCEMRRVVTPRYALDMLDIQYSTKEGVLEDCLRKAMYAVASEAGKAALPLDGSDEGRLAVVTQPDLVATYDAHMNELVIVGACLVGSVRRS